MTLPAVSRRMRAVRQRGTKCEAVLEAEMTAANLVYSQHCLIYNCRPDFCFKDERLAVFVDGDFWHGRILIDEGDRALKRSFKPEQRKFWVTKILRNVDRDCRQTARLRRNGWSVVRVWERDALSDPAGVVDRLCERLRRRRKSLLLA